MRFNNIYLILIMIICLFFSGCSLIMNDSSNSDISELTAFASGLETIVRFVADEESVGARTISAGTYEYGNEGETVTFLLTPQETYEALNPSGSTELIEIPGNMQYLNNFYNNPAYKAKITMEPKNGFYRIKLKIYDTSSFLLYNVYEEYYVTPNSWENLDREGNPGFFKSYDVMVDRSRITHSNIVAPGNSFDGNVYNIAVDQITTSSLNDYTYTIRNDYHTPTLFEAETIIPVPQRNIMGNYYSSKESVGNYSAEEARYSRVVESHPEFEAITYYAELNDSKERNMVVFSLQEVSGSNDNYARTVTRSQEIYKHDPEDDEAPIGLILEEKKIYSLTTFSWRNDNPWQHIAKEIQLSVDDNTGLTELLHTENVYYSGSAVDGNPDKTTVMSLGQIASPDSGFRYSGEMTVTWKSSNWVDTYSVTFYGKRFKIKSTGGYGARSLGNSNSGTEIELDLSYLENGEDFILNLSSGSRFEGSYYNGRLTGQVYFKNGDRKRIDIIDGTVFLNDELWKPNF